MTHTVVNQNEYAKFARRRRKAERLAWRWDLNLIERLGFETDAGGRETGRSEHGFMLIDPNARRIVLGDGAPGYLFSASLEQAEAFLATLVECGDDTEVTKAAESAAVTLA